MVNAPDSYRFLYIVRHGQYDSSISTLDGGGLTELGREQAAYVAHALSHLTIDKIHCSTMRRAVETAEIMAEVLNLSVEEPSDLLREAVPTMPPRFAAHFIDLMNRDPKFTHEVVHEDKKRADRAFETYFVPPARAHVDQRDVIVCHGNIMRYLTCKALGINVDTWGKLDVDHGGITTITINTQGLMRLVTHNETRHIPPEMLSN